MMYRNLLIIFLLFLNLSIVHPQTNIPNDLTIKYCLDTSRNVPIKVYVQKFNIAGAEVKTDTILPREELRDYQLKLNEPTQLKISFFWKGRRFSEIKLWADSGETVIQFINDIQPTLRKTGGSVSAKIAELEKLQESYQLRSEDLVSKVDYENKTVAEAESRIWQIRDSIDKEIDSEVYYHTVLRNRNSAVGLYALWQYAQRPFGKNRLKSFPAKIDSLLHQLSPDVQRLKSAVMLQNLLKLEDDQKPGSIIKDVRLKDGLGNFHSINQFRGKYVLVDFWASWCLPCRAQHPALISAFNKYHSAGFDIISITRDQLSHRADWMEAIKQDNISSWLHLSDFNNIAQQTFNIVDIPTNFLIDPSGKIIAKNIKSKQLHVLLKEIFGN